ncbi:hypothetical protein [Clostridium sp. CTA-5]
MDNGQWTMDNGQWTMDNGQSDYKSIALDFINIFTQTNFIFSCIKKRDDQK